jgi:hypothetical protein
MWKYFDMPDSAGLEATLQNWQQDMPGLGVLAFCSERSASTVPLLQQLANRQALPLAGAVMPGLVADGELKQDGILLAALNGTIPQATIPLPQGAEGTDDSAIAELAAFVEAHANENGDDTLLLFVDAMIPDIATLLDKLYLMVGNRVRYAGTSVGSESFKPTPCLFDNTAFTAGAVLAMLLPGHPGAAIAHRYCKATPLSTATGTCGNRIAFIDGRPAFEAYRDLIAKIHGVALTRENFYQHAVHFPLALHLVEGEPLVRIAVTIDEDGCLSCIGEIPEAALLSVVEAANPDSKETALEVASQMRAHSPAAAMTFYCAGRLLHHGAAAATSELCELQNALAPARVFGALSLGEIANYHSQGYPRFHNAALVALPWH